ncbi:FG-GAP-like repeat-containing protein [Hymenobacter yonginensis]|uniref:FG-GAP-like repeat-containing protein n=1 Tax=Hymenobacter yonginensis TaxID=748197 RepID=A0ABY7PI07_9BACT|nr:FG-GAP-like repeat-containing protein [Hymenobacter yonginensis]WBO83030.1 FG-GAP-like repeat-containing protein [Hymenobacter yonginensis]
MRFALLSGCSLLTLATLGLPAAAQAQAPTITSFTPATAAPGSTVTVTGTNLNGFTAVQLNGQRVSATSSLLLPASSLTFVVPIAAGSGSFAITTAAGTAVSATKLGITRTSSSQNYPQATPSTTGTTATGNFSTPVVCDLDADGRLELLVGQGNGTMIVYEQTAANGAFSTTGTLLTLSPSGTIDVGNFAKPTVTDLDSDGLQEILVGEELGKVQIYEQTARTGAGALTFDAGSTLFPNPYGVVTTAGTASANAGSYARPTITDFDGDGRIDILVGANDGTIRRYEQNTLRANTTAGFTDLGSIKLGDGTPLDAGSVSKPLVTDYDGDGKLDLVVGTLAGAVKLYTQTAVNRATFTFVRDLSTAGTDATVINMGNSGTNPSNVNGYAAPAVTDLDGDGLLDLFIGNANGSVFRYEQSTSATSPTITAPLPVVLKSFGGQATAEGALLRWSTAQEVNSDNFTLERSADGRTFQPVAQLPAAGNSTATRSYQYEDASAEARSLTTSYYRLQQQDLDGTVTVSPVVVVRRSGSTQAVGTASPNPFSQELYVALPAGTEPQPTQVTLTTLTGATVYSAKLLLSASPQLLPALPELKSGLYLLQLTTATKSTTQRVVRQ